MSGFTVAVRTDGGRVHHRLIERLTGALAIRGPDGQTTWCEGVAALGHSGFRVGSEAVSQPLTLDGSLWIVADARIDDRETLATTLGVRLVTMTDAELILRAFMKWDDGCVDHLLGDFAFAIWNRDERRLFCARDHLGVRPLAYVDASPWLLASSSVDSLRQHPAVSDALDDLAVADFLLFGHMTDATATTFRDIRRLPPAHLLTWSRENGCRTRRYWTLPIDEPVYRKDDEYGEELRALLNRAVRERLRHNRVGILFSGGLDSAAVAAAARRQAAREDGSVRAFTFVHESLLADEERKYAEAAATHLGIPCHFYESAVSQGWNELELSSGPEPLLRSVYAAAQVRCVTDMAMHSPIAFSGEGPDNALVYEWSSYLRYLWRGRRIGRIAADGVHYLRRHRRLPLWSTLTRHAATRAGEAAHSPIPSWMSRDLVLRLRLEDRWRYVMRPAVSRHPVRPAACFSFEIPLWHTLFDMWDPCYTGVPLEVRHPFLDLRVLRFLFTVPVIPWCREKHLMRDAFRHELPPLVLHRPKTALPGSPEAAKIRRDGLPPIVRRDRLEPYAHLAHVKELTIENPIQAEGIVRLATFSHWLSQLEPTGAAAASD